MLEKYIIAEVEHNKKGYSFHETYLSFDKEKSSIALEDNYVKKDIDDNICYLYSVFESMIKAGVYSSMSSIYRAIRNGILRAELLIIYISDLDKVSVTNGWYIMKDSNSLEEMLKYSSSVQYVYSMKDKSIRRYEIYGDPILGDDICRPISDLI